MFEKIKRAFDDLADVMADNELGSPSEAVNDNIPDIMTYKAMSAKEKYSYLSDFRRRVERKVQMLKAEQHNQPHLVQKGIAEIERDLYGTEDGEMIGVKTLVDELVETFPFPEAAKLQSDLKETIDLFEAVKGGGRRMVA